MNIVAIVQARLGSKRLPNKVIKPINGLPMIEVLLTRLSKSKLITKIVVATSEDDADKKLKKLINKLGYDCEQGSKDDVLKRYITVAEKYEANIIVRITGDCPLVDPDLVDQVINKFINDSVDYCSNTIPATYPDGLDVEVFTIEALKKSSSMTTNSSDLEHVTPYLKESGNFKTSCLENHNDLSEMRWTVDESIDLEVVDTIFKSFAPDLNFSWLKVLDLQKIRPEIFKNSSLIRNEGFSMTNGQKLWKRAKQIIPGGNMLLSKRPEMFLPDLWPSYFSKSKGCNVWDLNGKKYIDMSIMGIGTNILGYGHPEVDEAVHKTIDSGNMSTLNCPEEVYLAEKLIEINPWADMVRFARSGGEANAIAIRIARAASNKDKVAICGYHGWHDWYLSVNLSDNKNLANHLLPGLEPKGVPENLRDTVFPFNYNDFETLVSLVKKEDIGIIKMEVERTVGPEDNFLTKVRKLATENNIVLIFDECTSGFRETFGGIYKKYNVEPDMAMYGKALGNGYAITAVVGKKEIMEAAQTTFISSTFWTERIGPTAAIKTLEIMERDETWKTITKLGLYARNELQKLADKYQIEIAQWGIPALTGYSFKGRKSLHYKTLVTQEMLKKGYLTGNTLYICIHHTTSVIDEFIFNLDPIFLLIKECEEGRDINSLLSGPICHSGFERLN
jgi:glutamate-1-semialdehyde 2,1-aminomutase